MMGFHNKLNQEGFDRGAYELKKLAIKSICSKSDFLTLQKLNRKANSLKLQDSKEHFQRKKASKRVQRNLRANEQTIHIASEHTKNTGNPGT